ncbi:MAG TPA: S8 family serine peptidase, partial [Acidimicrobiales bacterium]|nr:S8 family serine peptidase [Acidimicrobiales bacterium]
MRRTCAAALAALTACLLAVTPAARGAANDPAQDRQWGMRLIGAPQAWDRGTGAGVTIAVVDTGVALNHEDLAGRLVAGTNIVDPAKPPQDDNGHGTHVAGIAAASTNNGRGVVSVAPDAMIMPVKVFGANGKAAEADIVSGVKWAVDHGAKVVNMSFGDDLQPLLGPGFSDAVRYAWSKGVVSVVAAGNGGGSLVTSSGFSQENALVVSAVTKNDTKPDYSSDVGQAKWGIAAPGGADKGQPAEDYIFSTVWTKDHPSAPNYYAYMSGTSMAAPHVSGAVAVLLSRGFTPQQAVDRLLATAKDIGPAGKDSTFGYGRLDMAKAVAGLAPTGGGSTATTVKSATTTTRRPSKTTQPAKGTAGTVPGTASTNPGATSSTAGTTDTTEGLRIASPRAGPGSGQSGPHPDGSDTKPWLAAAVGLAALAGAAR